MMKTSTATATDDQLSPLQKAAKEIAQHEDCRTWFDEQLDSDAFDIDAAYEQVHQNHIVRGIAPKWSENNVGLSFRYCLAQGDFEHHGPYCGYRLPLADCDSCGKHVPESEVKSAMTSAGVEGSFCHECRHGKTCDCPPGSEPNTIVDCDVCDNRETLGGEVSERTLEDAGWYLGDISVLCPEHYYRAFR